MKDESCDLHPPGTCNEVICGKCHRYKFRDGPCICDFKESETYQDLVARAQRDGRARSVDGSVCIYIPKKDLPCPICGDALEAMTRERDAYRKAKQENDERFQNERDEARAQVVKLTADLEIAHANLEIGDAEMAWALSDFKKIQEKLATLEAKHRKCPWIEGDEFLQGEHEADIGSIGLTYAGIKKRETKHPVGVVVLLLSEGKVWLATRVAKDRAYEGMLAAPGGSVEPGEEFPNAAQREVAEETGLDIAQSRLNYGGRTEHTYDNGKPFSMHWFHVQLSPNEIPLRTEPHKQGEWTLHEIHNGLKDTATPGTWEALKNL